MVVRAQLLGLKLSEMRPLQMTKPRVWPSVWEAEGGMEANVTLKLDCGTGPPCRRRGQDDGRPQGERRT